MSTEIISVIFAPNYILEVVLARLFKKAQDCFGAKIKTFPELSHTYGALTSTVARASVLWLRGCGFDLQLSHIKDFKNGTTCSFAWHSALRKES